MIQAATNRAAEAAQQLLLNLGIAAPEEISLEAICVHLGLTVVEEPLEGCDSRLVRVPARGIVASRHAESLSCSARRTAGPAAPVGAQPFLRDLRPHPTPCAAVADDLEHPRAHTARGGRRTWRGSTHVRISAESLSPNEAQLPPNRPDAGIDVARQGRFARHRLRRAPACQGPLSQWGGGLVVASPSTPSKPRARGSAPVSEH